MRNLPLSRMLLVSVGMVLCVASTHAQEASSRQASRDRELLRRAQAAQKQAEEALGALQQEKAKLEATLAEIRGKAAAAGELASKEKARAAKLAVSSESYAKEKEQLLGERTSLSSRVARLEAELAQARAQLVSTEKALADKGTELTRLQSSSSRTESSLATCNEKNTELYAVARELSDKYRDVGVWDVMRRREPFTGKRQVEVENLLEEFRDRVDAARVAPGR